MLGRALAAGGSVLVAAAVNVTTGMLTQHWAAAWWAATAVLVVLGCGLQIWLTFAGSSVPVRASGDGSIASAGSVARVSTTVTRARRSADAPAADGMTASGAGAIAAGGDVTDAQITVSDDR
jgi:uncharacterized protein (DUF58 family)